MRNEPITAMALAAAEAPAAPAVFDGIATTIAVVVLLIEFLMLRSMLLRTQIRLYAVQSMAVAVLSVCLAIGDRLPELYVLAALSVVLKVVVVPLVLFRLLDQTGEEIAGSSAISVASAVIVAVVVAGFGTFAVGTFGFRSSVLPGTALSLSFAVVLVAFVLMILRRDVVSQAVGFFSLENGVSMASLVVAAGLPLIFEVAFLFDLLVAVVVFGVLMRLHHQQSRSLSTESLTRLRG